ncbi:oligosaccharyltransferase complex subunit gamma [Sarotherodon galilaeus]
MIVHMCVDGCVSEHSFIGAFRPGGCGPARGLATPEATHLLLIRPRRGSYLRESWSSHRRGIIAWSVGGPKSSEHRECRHGGREHKEDTTRVLGNTGIYCCFVPYTVNKRTVRTQSTAPGSSFPTPPTVCQPDRDRMIPPDMDQAVSEERLRREIMDRVYRLCELWWEKPAEGLRRAVERRLQETLFKFPWLVDDLNPIVMDFLLSTLHLHSPPQAAHQPGQLVDSQPDTPAPTLTRKRRSRRRHSSPQPNSRTSQEPAVVSNKDTFSFLTPSASLFTVDGDTTDAAVSQPTVQLASPHSAISTPLTSSPSLAVPPATTPPGPAQPEPEELALPEQELSKPEEGELELSEQEPEPELSEQEPELSEQEPELELAPPAEELSVPPAEEPVPLPEELNEPEGPALPAEELGEREELALPAEELALPAEEPGQQEEPVLPAEDLSKPEGPA